jgi:hypothetical protein
MSKILYRKNEKFKFVRVDLQITEKNFDRAIREAVQKELAEEKGDLDIVETHVTHATHYGLVVLVGVAIV